MAIKSEHIIERQGQKVVLYRGLLEEAHSLGLEQILTDLVQIPTADNGNVAIAKATVVINSEGRSGKFQGIGDASPDNVGRMILPHIIRMAETRAKARALRDAVNIGMVSLEELGDDEPIHQGTKAPASPADTNAPSYCAVCKANTRREKAAKDGSGRTGWVCTKDPSHPWEWIK